MELSEKLIYIQSSLKAPKNQFNSFGKYKYRSCEDILEGVKPLLREIKCALYIDDEVISLGTRYYIKSTATLIDTENKSDKISTSAFAREEETKKGMDASQVTGTASSYARKYALNGLFAIDDTKDSDVNLTDLSKQDKKRVCADCGKEFKAFTDQSGKEWNAGQVYHMAISTAKKRGIKDGQARCSNCLNKIEAQLLKENK